MQYSKVHARDAGVMHLPEELTEVRTTFVIDPCVGDKGCTVAAFDDAVREVDILAKAHGTKTSQSVIDLTANTHVERTWEELIEFLFAAADASGGKERGHAIVDSLLNGCERLMCTVGSAESVHIVMGKEGIEGIEIAFGHEYVGVEDDEPFALARALEVVGIDDVLLLGACLRRQLRAVVRAGIAFFREFQRDDFELVLLC